MTTVLVVGGGSNQVPLVATARKMGLRVVVTDMYPSPPCKGLADAFEQINTVDHLATLKVAKKYGISAVITDQTDAAVPTVAYVADELGLKGIGYDVALRFSNKFVSRTYLEPLVQDLIPKFQFFQDEASAVRQAVASSTPTVVKPINSQGSKGVSLIECGSESNQIERAFAESRGRGVLLEEFVAGEEFSVESFTVSGHVHNLAITRKYHYASNPCIDVRNTYLGDVPPSIEAKLFKANTRVLTALGLPFGSSHAEFMVDESGIKLIEIACRGGGGGISTHLVPYLTGFEPNSALLSVLLDRPCNIAYGDYRTRFAVLKFLEFKPGRVRRVVNSAQNISGLLAMEIAIQPGQDIHPVKSSRDRPGHFIVIGADRLQVLERERRVQERVKIDYVK